MIFLQKGLYVVIHQLDTELSPIPKPLLHGFSQGFAYLVLGAFSLSESGEAYLILSNDEDEIWFISNRHLRTHRLLPESNAFRLALKDQGTNAPQVGRDGKKSSRSSSVARNGVSDKSAGRAPRAALRQPGSVAPKVR